MYLYTILIFLEKDYPSPSSQHVLCLDLSKIYIFFFCELVHFGASFQMMWMADTPSRLIDRFLVVEVFFNLLFNPCFWKQPVWTMEPQTLLFSIITTSTTVFLDCGGLGKKGSTLSKWFKTFFFLVFLNLLLLL